MWRFYKQGEMERPYLCGFRNGARPMAAERGDGKLE